MSAAFYIDALNLTLYLSARVDIIHIGVENDLEHHLRMVGTASAFAVQFLEIAQVKVLDYRINNAYRVVFRLILIRIKQKEQPIVVIVRFCM